MYFRTIALAGLLLCSAATAQTINNLGRATAPIGTELVPLLQGSNPALQSTAQCVAAAQEVNPICANASGSTTTTTGTISSGAASLVVASAAGWSVGMGVAVANAGAGGNTELISSVSACGAVAPSIACGSTTFTLANNAVTTATGQTVNHDDTAAISAAITSAMSTTKPLHLSRGNYNVTSALTSVSSPIKFFGDGAALSIIWNRGKTNNVLVPTYTTQAENAGCGGIVNGSGWCNGYQGNSALFQDFQISQASGITPSAGYGIAVQGGSGNFSLTNLHVNRVLFNNLWGGISTSGNMVSNWFTSLYMNAMIGGDGIHYNAPSPSGDNHWNDIELSGNNTQFNILQSDTQWIVNLKTNGSGIIFNGTTANTFRVHIVNPSLEGFNSLPACLLEFGAGASDISVIGGGVGLGTKICHAANVAGLRLDVDTYDAGVASDVFLNWTPSIAVGNSAASLTISPGEVGLSKMTASGAAPGALGLKFGAVCGTNAGSLKIIAYAGTSTTPVTVVDNVGSGVTGC